jgi:poly(A) polymerase
MEALQRAGGADCARFVGGCVRNAILGAPVRDIDIATTLTPPKVTAALEAAGLKAVPTGIDHGTITAVALGRPLEITTLRRDVSTDGRRAVVAFTTQWSEDAGRRDFRLNALYADAEGAVYDPTGAGLADARAGAIVFVGDPVMRIREDALRILRYFRFLAWYGRGEPDPAALAACRGQRALIAGLSAERIGYEVLRLLEAPDPRAALRLMAQTGVLALLVPVAVDLTRLEALVSIETERRLAPDPLLRLAALLPPNASQAALDTTQRLRLSGAQRDRLAAALDEGPPVVSSMSPRELRRFVYRLGAQTFRDRAMLTWAASPTPASGAQWDALLPMARNWRRPTLPLTGDDVLAAGVPAGPRVGAILREVEAWWVDNDFTADKRAVAERLGAAIQSLSD